MNKGLIVLVFVSVFLISFVSATITCVDTDAGKDIGKYGYTTFTYDGNVLKNNDSCVLVSDYDSQNNPSSWKSVDSCSGERCYVKEAYCNEDEQGNFFDADANVLIECASGCDNGECINFQKNVGEKDLIAKGFILSNVTQGIQILLDYEEVGLSSDDDYFTEMFFNGEMVTRMDRDSLELNGPGMNFWKMLLYKITFSNLIVTAKMDYIEQKGTNSSNDACSSGIDCLESRPRSQGLQLCVKGRCTSIDEMDNSIKETNEDNNCIQQEFKINLFARQLIPVSSPTFC